MTDLLSCPFCGGKNAYVQNAGWKANTFIRCPDCPSSFAISDGPRPHEDSVAAWNRRALPPVDGLEVVALDLTKRIEREFYSDQPGGAVQTRAKVQVIIAEALSQASSVIAGMRSERITAERDALDAYGKLQAAEARISSLEEENKRLKATIAFTHRWAVEKEGNGTSVEERLSAIANHPGIKDRLP